MKMINKQFVDNLRRAFLMEEDMAGTLLSLCEAETEYAGLSSDQRDKFLKTFATMRKDTERHKAIVSAILSKHVEA
jgi:hypothetical protein